MANIFIITELAIFYTWTTLILVEIDPQTYTMDVSLLEAASTEGTRVIIPVHLYGQPADMDPILKIAQGHDLVLIEDACQTNGTRYEDKRVSSCGIATGIHYPIPIHLQSAYRDLGKGKGSFPVT